MIDIFVCNSALKGAVLTTVTRFTTCDIVVDRRHIGVFDVLSRSSYSCPKLLFLLSVEM